MTENLLQKIEDRMSAVLTELDTLRREVYQLKQENFSLKSEKANYTEKLQELLSLFDILDNNTTQDLWIANDSQVKHLHGECASA